MRNKRDKSEIKTAVRKVLKSLESPQAGESAAPAGLYKSFVRKIDRAASGNVVHWKTNSLSASGPSCAVHPARIDSYSLVMVPRPDGAASGLVPYFWLFFW